MKKYKHRIISVAENSIAEEMELEAGDILLDINGQIIEDVFDYRYFIEDECFTMHIKKANGEEWELEIEKDYDENIGLEFENALMSNYRSCHNDCTFCFVSQMPEGMRDTLYFKDDDYRLSFLQGNYITLTNLTAHDVDRIIKYRLEPLNISVQTMNKDLRNKMLKNRFAGDSLKIIDRLAEAGIKMNAQIVLCKNHNDGEELKYSIEQLEKYLPYIKSLTIVPVGLSKHREGLTDFEPFTKEDAIEITDLIEKVQNETYKKHGYYYIHASDEWYALAEKEVPSTERYEGFEELENGVGMLRLLEDEVISALEAFNDHDLIKEHTVSIVTGELAYPYICSLAKRITEKCNKVHINVYEVINKYFGESVTVAGLLTGVDLITQLKGKQLGDKLIIPISMLRSGKRVFLDDMTVSDVEKSLNTNIAITEVDGRSFVENTLLSNNCDIRNNETVGYIDLFNRIKNDE